MDILNSCLKERKLHCCSAFSLKGPSEVCITLGCNSRLICEHCSKGHAPGHKFILLHDFLQMRKSNKERYVDSTRFSEKDFEKEILLVIYQTESLLKALKKTQKIFDNLRKSVKDAFVNFESSIHQLLSQASRNIVISS